MAGAGLAGDFTPRAWCGSKTEVGRLSWDLYAVPLSLQRVRLPRALAERGLCPPPQTQRIRG